MSELTNVQKVQEALDAAIPDIVEALKNELVQGISYQVKQEIQQQVITTVRDWYQADMVEDVRTILVDSKLGMLGSIVPFAEQLQKQLLEGMLTDLTKNLGQTYSRNKIMESLFK